MGERRYCTMGTARIATITPLQAIAIFVKKLRLENSGGEVIGYLPSVLHSWETAAREISPAAKRSRPPRRKYFPQSSACRAHRFASRDRPDQDDRRSRSFSIPDRSARQETNRRRSSFLLARPFQRPRGRRHNTAHRLATRAQHRPALRMSKSAGPRHEKYPAAPSAREFR